METTFMPIYLVQHGKSLSKEEDPSRGLSEEGIKETKQIADVAKGYGVHVQEIQHSPKIRAAQTADIFTTAINPSKGVKEIAGIKPMDDVMMFAKSLNTNDNIMIVGHLPFMERLCAYLVTGNYKKSIFKFQNSGIVCLDNDDTSGSWIIKWTLMPSIG